MGFREKIDSFCQKLEAMAKEVSTSELNMSLGTADVNMSILVMIYRAALELFASNEECSVVLERIHSEAQNQNLQEVFSQTSENDVQVLGNFAESFFNEGKVREATQMFQFLTLFCPQGAPNPYTYLRLAESLSMLNIDAGLQLYDFVLNIFPDNPAILLSAGKIYHEGERPKRALRVLTHAKEVCEHNLQSNPGLQEFLDLLHPELEKVQKKIAQYE